MCGILGVVGTTLPSQEQVEKSCDVLAHRGPNDSGYYYSEKEGIALAQRRLSIIDLSSDGHQPFCDTDGRFVLVFNGEIYNYIELREELQSVYPFRTKTDTEVILAAYVKWGSDCVKKMNGMFAFALWDKQKSELFCARDHVGIKPFFYTKTSNYFGFASEIKALFPFGIEKKPNESVIFDYLQYGYYDHRNETFFEGIFSLPAGHFLTWKNGETKIEKYWSLAEVEPCTLGEDEVVKKFDALLQDAVGLQFRSDVAVGINLSSGLDSNSLLSYGRSVVGDDIHTFSICLSDDEFNECELIDSFSDFGNKKLWHKSYFSPENLMKQILRMVKIQDQPYGGIPTLIYTTINEAAKNSGVTVLLEGQGIDEMLAGYRYYRNELDRDLGVENETSLFLSQDGSSMDGNSLLSDSFVERYHSEELHFETPFNSHLLNAQYRDFVYTKIPRVLRFNDHVSMAYSRELRVPFLDYRIAEFCFSLPSQYKIQGSNQKVLMRKLMNDRVPKSLLDRPKKTFGAVQNIWLKKYLEKEILEILDSKSFQNRGYWNYERLNEKVKRFFEGKEDNSFFLWQCINLELWFREFIDSNVYFVPII